MPKAKKKQGAVIKAALICDDARKEMNGKDIIIGVYTGDIVVSSFPATIALMVWLELTPAKLGPSRVDYRFIFNGVPIATVMGTVEVVALGGEATLSLPKMPLKFTKSGTLTLEIAFEEGEWMLVKTKGVKAGEVPDPSPTVSPATSASELPPPSSQSVSAS